MSRTFRRTKRGVKTDWLPGYGSGVEKEFYKEAQADRLQRWKDARAKGCYFSGITEKMMEADRNWQRFVDEHPEYHDWFLGFGEPGPSAFRNYTYTRPRRRRDRELCRKVKYGADYDAMNFYHHNKPKIYWT